MKANERNLGLHLRAVFLLVAAVSGLALLATWRPGTSGAPGDPAGLVVVAAAWVAWALTIYLAVGTAVTAAGYLGAGPSSLGRLAPPALRRCVAVAVGASSAAAVCLAPAVAYADAPMPAPAATAAPLDWPGLRATPLTAHPDTARPASRRAAVRIEASTPRPRPPAPVVVRPGDSLWSVTARLLGPHASAARIATGWPRLYAANRHAIGADPNLIHPGQRLVLPNPEGRTSR